MLISERIKQIGKKTPQIIQDLIDSMMMKGKSESEALKLVYGDGSKPGLGEKFGWLARDGTLTTYGIEKSTQDKKERLLNRIEAKRSNLSIKEIDNVKRKKSKPRYVG